MADNIYYCSNCGGVMEFDVKTQTLKCPNCDTQVNIVNDTGKIVEHNFTIRAARTIPVAEKQSSTMQCQGCGAKVEISADCTATECAYCGAKYVLAEKQEEAIVPDGVIPFKVDKKDVKETFTKWINKRWLAPGKLKHLYESDKIQGIYVPYWTFDADVVCDYSAQGGKRRKEKVTNSDGSVTEKTVTDWYNTHGRVKEFFDDVLVKASKNLKASLLKGVEPYDTKGELASYAPEYLSGYGAECYTISLEDAHREANRIMEQELKRMAERDVRRQYDDVKNVRIAPDYRKETYKHILIPVYSTAFTYNNKNYTVLINGQTGKIKGDYPKSPAKIAVIVAVIAAAIVGLLFLSSSKNKSDNNGADVGSAVYTVDYLCEDAGCYEIDYLTEDVKYSWEQGYNEVEQEIIEL
ncbi:MAG: hypothetical protein K2N34_04275 [Lachnospiraceae bacterium]|nr:hypothetical protein [Lachnospiraceae bacterium]